jgi:ABC-type multidrug transport system, permease component
MSAIKTAKLTSPVLVGIRRIPFELLMFSRELSAVVFSFAYPVVMYLIFVGSEVFDLQLNDFTFAGYFLPGMIATGILLSTTQELGPRIVAERESSLLKRLRTTPATALSYVISKVGQVTVITMLQVSLLLVIAHFCFDAPLPPDSEAWILFSATLLLGIACGAAVGFALAQLIPTVRSANGTVMPVLLVLQFFSGVFFPFFSLPAWMRAIADVFPLRWLTSNLRAVFFPESFAEVEPSGSFQVGTGLIMLSLWFLVSIIVAVRFFRWVPHEQK